MKLSSWGLASTLAALPGTALAVPQLPPQEDPQPVEAPADGVPTIELIDLEFDDALSRAERVGKMLVIFWARGEDDVRTREFREEILGDTGVRRWVAEEAIAVRVDADKDKKGARANLVKIYPSIDVIDVRRGARIERLVPGFTATDLLASIYGADAGTAPEQPEGDAATEPFQWLAWGNHCARSNDPALTESAVEAYSWCLLNADDYRPEFRARFLEYLLKKVASLQLVSRSARRTLSGERQRLESKVWAGTATRRDLYEISRIDFWIKKNNLTRDLYLELANKDSEQNRVYRSWLFFPALPILGRNQHYREILDIVGDEPMALFRDRIAIERASAAAAANAVTSDGEEAVAEPDEATPKPPLEHMVPDRRAEILDDASWVYEALLGGGRGADARAFVDEMSEFYPTAGLYGRCMERAMRLEMWDLAIELGDVALGTVDEQGKRRIQRLRSQIPVDDDGE
ncbi:MAG: hypothetical protein AAF726_08290 [Planctomycetota bacterium]